MVNRLKEFFSNFMELVIDAGFITIRPSVSKDSASVVVNGIRVNIKKHAKDLQAWEDEGYEVCEADIPDEFYYEVNGEIHHIDTMVIDYIKKNSKPYIKNNPWVEESIIEGVSFIKLVDINSKMDRLIAYNNILVLNVGEIMSGKTFVIVNEDSTGGMIYGPMSSPRNLKELLNGFDVETINKIVSNDGSIYKRSFIIRDVKVKA